MNFTTPFHYGYFLQIGMKSSIGRPHGEAPVMTEGGRFTTMLTNCHFEFLSLHV
jgi:hypothetical protein